MAISIDVVARISCYVNVFALASRVSNQSSALGIGVVGSVYDISFFVTVRKLNCACREGVGFPSTRAEPCVPIVLAE